jgi:hypothetical protein
MSSRTRRQAPENAQEQVAAALRGVDTPVFTVPASSGMDGRRVPRKLRPKPRVAGEKAGQKPSFWGMLVLVLIWLTDLPQELYDWIADSITIRRKRRPLRGGWRSRAGGMLAAVDAEVWTYLAVGASGVHIVYVGELGSEIGWSSPRAEVRGAESLAWAKSSPYVANVRFHFTDGSWASFQVRGAARGQLLEHFPESAGKRG